MRVLRRCDDGTQVVWHRKFRHHRRVAPDTPVRSQRGNSLPSSICAFSGRQRFHDGKPEAVWPPVQAYGMFVRDGAKAFVPSPGGRLQRPHR